MKNTLLFLLLILSCSTTKYYKVADLQLELNRNAEQLRYIEQSVSSDFRRKLSLFEKFSPRLKKKNFLTQELNWRLKEMEMKKRSLIKIGHRIKNKNQSLLDGISGRKRISDNEPIFRKIEDFGSNTTVEAQALFEAFDEYRSASASFTKVMLFSKSSLQGSTSKKL